MGTVELVVQVVGAASSSTIMLKMTARISAPLRPRSFQALTGILSGPVVFPIFHLLDGCLHFRCHDQHDGASDGVGALDWRIRKFVVADLREVIAPALEDGRGVSRGFAIVVLDVLNLADILRCAIAGVGQSINFVCSFGRVQLFVKPVMECGFRHRDWSLHRRFECFVVFVVQLAPGLVPRFELDSM